MEEILTDDEKLNTTEKKDNLLEDSANFPLIEEMMRVSLFGGLKSSKTHPKMKPYIVGVRNGISIIDLEETLKLLDAAMEFVKSRIAPGSKAGVADSGLSTEKGNILLVGTTPSAKRAVERTAKKLGLLFVTERWLGGILTNFKTLSKRIAYFKKLKSDREAGRLDKYTKKERVGFNRQIQKMSMMFSGLETMERLPDILFIVDVNAHMTAVREAKRLKIPVIGVMNANTNPKEVDYPIPANDRSKSGIEWILERLEKTIEEARAKAN